MKWLILVVPIPHHRPSQHIYDRISANVTSSSTQEAQSLETLRRGVVYTGAIDNDTEDKNPGKTKYLEEAISSLKN